MKLMEREDALSSAGLWSLLLLIISYRAPMPVTELMAFESWRRKDYYYVCPRCKMTMEREFIAYCDRCGQCLDWKRYKEARIVYPGRDREQV